MWIHKTEVGGDFGNGKHSRQKRKFKQVDIRYSYEYGIFVRSPARSQNMSMTYRFPRGGKYYLPSQNLEMGLVDVWNIIEHDRSGYQITPEQKASHNASPLLLSSAALSADVKLQIVSVGSRSEENVNIEKEDCDCVDYITYDISILRNDQMLDWGSEEDNQGKGDGQAVPVSAEKHLLCKMICSWSTTRQSLDSTLPNVRCWMIRGWRGCWLMGRRRR